MIYRSDKVELLNRWMVEERSGRERYRPYARGGDNRDSGRRFDQHRSHSRHDHAGRRDSRDHRDDRRDGRGNERGGREAFLRKYPQVQTEQRAPVHVSTAAEVVHSL